ncbi:MAG: hypothetical protein QOD72_2147 [Acidimicrobiaceae bacterium]|jgi:hypothetical protein|nr:hypothetical protein [Acidimicrobiaceae bacterium]
MSTRSLVRVAAALAVAVAGYVHLILYRRSYHAIPRVGAMFAIDVVIAAGVAAALVVTRHRVVVFVGLAQTAAALGGFALSRTIGLWGFKEPGFNPAPHAAVALGAELAALLLLIVAGVDATRVQSHI